MTWPLISMVPALTPPPRKMPTIGMMSAFENAATSGGERGADDDGDGEVDDVAAQ